ncbi:unnamed protein product [Effrenium voratum]|nr:unnamed protein product [Effrenium voratum]
MLPRSSIFAQEGVRSPAPFTSLLDGYGKVGDLESAGAVLDQMRRHSVQPNTNCYNSLINAYAKAGEMKLAVTAMSNMRSQKLRADVITYTSIISGFASSGRMTLAKEWLTNMRDMSFEPNVVTFGTVLQSCHKLHKVEEAEELLQDMRKMKVEPNLVIFNTMLNIYASARRGAKAEQVFRELVRRGRPDAAAFGSLVKASARMGDMQRCMSWMQRAEASERLDAKAYYSLISACAQAGDVAAARKALEEMKGKGLAEDTIACTGVVRACAVAGDLPEAEKTLRHMEASGLRPNTFTANAVMTLCANAQRPLTAEKWFFRLAKQWVAPEVVVFNSLLLNWKQDPCRMQEWMRRMRVAKQLDVITYNCLLNAAAIVNDDKLASETWAEMRQQFRPTLGSYRSYSKALARVGRYDTLSSLLEEMATEFPYVDAFCRRALISACANAQSNAQRGLDEKAAEVARAAFLAGRQRLAGDVYARRAARLALGSTGYRKLLKELKLEPSEVGEVEEPQETFREARRVATAHFVVTPRGMPGFGVQKATPRIASPEQMDGFEEPQQSAFTVSSAAEPLLRLSGRRGADQELAESTRLKLKPARP